MKSTWRADFTYFPSVENNARFGDYFSKSKWIKSSLVYRVLTPKSSTSTRLIQGRMSGGRAARRDSDQGGNSRVITIHNHLKLLICTTSPPSTLRDKANCLPSRDKSNHEIPSDLKSVSCVGGLPSRGRFQRFQTSPMFFL